MKVQELIEVLSKYPKDATVVVTDKWITQGLLLTVDDEDWEACIQVTKPGKLGEPGILPHA